MFAVNFKDFGNVANELLKDDFLYTKRLKIQTTNKAGVEWSGGGTLGSNGAIGYMSAKYSNPNGFSIENFRIKSDGRIFADAYLKITESLKLTSSIEDGRQEPGKPLHSFGKLGFEYISSLVNTSGEIDVVNGPSLQSAVLFHHGPFRAGAELLFNSHLEEKDQSSEIVDFNVGFSFEGSDSHTSVTTTDMLGNIRMAYVHHVSPVLDCVGQVDYRLKTNYQRICLGVKWRLDDKTVIKAKVDSDALLATSFRQGISTGVDLSLASEIDLKEMGSDSYKFGMGLEFTF